MQNVSVGSQSFPQSSNVGVGSSSTPLQAFPWGGGNIPPSFPSLGVGLSHLLSLIPSWDGVVLWVVDSSLSTCHLLLTHSHYLVGSRAIPFPHLECRRGKPLPSPVESHAQGYYSSQGMFQGETPFSVITIQCKGVSLHKGCQQGETLLCLTENQMGGGFPLYNQVIKVLPQTLWSIHKLFLATWCQ
jgi:hypothetical protein